MEELTGRIVPIRQLGQGDTAQMFSLMDTFYAYMEKAIFLSDLSKKDYCVLLYDDRGVIQGFSTQQLLKVKVGSICVHGVFSGDTIIHKDCWGSMEIFKCFARFFFPYGAQYEHFYWFLSSKGYKTYKILPTFFQKFYPNYHDETPPMMKNIMDAFGKGMYPVEYEQETGVIVYRQTKDTLKPGVADITPRHLRDPDIAFFAARNPAYQRGNDMVCIAELKERNLKPMIRRLFFSSGEDA